MAQVILVIDDAENLRQLVKAYLTQEGYQIVTAANGRDGLFVARTEKPDLILLDLMMPEMGGYDFLKHYSREGNAPIIILTARIEESDKVLGLELGADDYVTKPFSMRELTARVRAVLRRAGKGTPQAEILRVGGVTLDRSARLVQVSPSVNTAVGSAAPHSPTETRLINLTPSEFDLLSALMASPGRVYSRMELLDVLQGTAYEGYERTIDVHIRNLRLKVESDPSQPRYIETVYGHGYRFAPEL